MRLPIPVNIVTGALGAGKTTAIGRLLSAKPPGETWAVLVNEFGSLGIDGALLEGNSVESADNGIVIRELAGGCLCCTMSGPLGVSVAQLVRKAKPNRLIIEPSGLGHPAGLLDTLQNEHLRSALDIKAIICMVDVRQVRSTPFESNETYQDQVNVCDIVVGTKSDLVQPCTDMPSTDCESPPVNNTEAEGDQAAARKVEKDDPLGEFWSWSSELYPPKAKVLVASHGYLDPALLDLSRDAVYQPFYMAAHRRGSRGRAGSSVKAASAPALAPISMSPLAEGRDPETLEAEGGGQLLQKPEVGKPLRFVSEASSEHVACGWVFSVDSVFKRDELCRVLQALHPLALRLKGVFRVGPKTWVVPRFPHLSTSVGEVSLEALAYRRESRIEMIVASPSRQPTEGTAVAAVAKQIPDALDTLDCMLARLGLSVEMGMWDDVEGCLNKAVNQVA